MNVDYESHNITDLCLLPSYLVIAFILSDKGIFIWFVGIILMFMFCNILYHLFVISPIMPSLEKWKRYWLFFAGQIVFWFLVYAISTR